MATWYPGATIITGNNAGTFVAGYTKKGILHTTEGSTAAGAIQAYKNANSWPHFTVHFTVYQHIAIDKAARALKNLSGGVETNRGGAIQIEVVGFASEAGAWPAGQVAALKKLMRWIEAETGIKPHGPVFGSNAQYGLNNPLEFTNAYWKTFDGWCGHQHVPENKHWDPGAINIATLLPSPAPPDTGIVIIKTEEVDMTVTYVNVSIPTDGAGNGWKTVPYQIDKIVSFLPQGIRPGVDGAYETNEVGFAQEDPNTVVSVVGWAPNSTAIVRLRVSG